MAYVQLVRHIKAPAEKVFDSVAHIRSYAQAVPHIEQVEILSSVQTGVGTRFRETRRMGRKLVSAELEVTEYAPHSRVRIVSDAGGTVWDTVFTIRDLPNNSTEDGVELSVEMEARAHRFLAKLMTPLIRGMVARGVTADIDSVKSYCEASSTAAGPDAEAV